LIKGRQQSDLVRGENARAVCVPPSRVVSFGCDQHVFAHRVQRTVAKGAPIGGRLQVLGAANRPPTCLVEICHEVSVTVSAWTASSSPLRSKLRSVRSQGLPARSLCSRA